MNFNVDERVRITRFPQDNILNGVKGTILGCSWDLGVDLPGWKSYIVLLDDPIKDAKAVSVTNACLERI